MCVCVCMGARRVHACGNLWYLPVAKQAVSCVYHFVPELECKLMYLGRDRSTSSIYVHLFKSPTLYIIGDLTLTKNKMYKW